MGTATHLPLRAGHNRMLTAEAGGLGSESSPDLFFTKNILNSVTLILETGIRIGYNSGVYAKKAHEQLYQPQK